MIDDFDELASAYLDGQATPDEVARVEADPELRARVDALRAVAEQLAADLPGPQPDTRERHLAAALAAFDAAASAVSGDAVPTAPAPGSSVPARGPGGGPEGPGIETGPGVVEVGGARIIDLSDRRLAGGIDAPPPVRTSPQHAATVAAAPVDAVAERRRRRSGGLPSWLGAAAAAVLVVGGIGIFAANRGPSDDSETAFGSQDAVESDAEASGAAEQATEMLAQESAPALGGANEDDAEDVQERVDEQAVTTTAAEGEAGGAGADDRLSFPAVPTEAELVEARAGVPLGAPAMSACGGLVAAPDGGELAGYLAVDVAGVPGEALVFTLADGGESIVLVTADCQPF